MDEQEIKSISKDFGKSRFKETSLLKSTIDLSIEIRNKMEASYSIGFDEGYDKGYAAAIKRAQETLPG